MMKMCDDSDDPDYMPLSDDDLGEFSFTDGPNAPIYDLDDLLSSNIWGLKLIMISLER